MNSRPSFDELLDASADPVPCDGWPFRCDECGRFTKASELLPVSEPGHELCKACRERKNRK